MIHTRSYRIATLFFILLILISSGILLFQLQKPSSDKLVKEDLSLLMENLTEALALEWEKYKTNPAKATSRLFQSSKLLEYQNDSLVKWKEADLEFYLQNTLKLQAHKNNRSADLDIDYLFEVNLVLDESKNFLSGYDQVYSKWNYELVDHSKFSIENQDNNQIIYLNPTVKNLSKLFHFIKSLLFFVGFLGLSMVAYKSYFTSNNYVQRFWSSFLFGIGILAPWLLGYLTDPGFIFFSTPFYFLYYGLVSLSLVGFFNRYIQLDHNRSDQRQNWIAFTSIIFILITGFILLISSDFIISKDYLDLNFEGVFYSPINGIISLAGIILGLVAIFLLHFKVYGLYHQVLAPKMAHKWFLTISSIALICLVVHYQLPALNPFIVAVSLMIYLLMLDLFVDSKSFNISWVILWLFLISSFYTLTLFGLKTYHEKQESAEILQQVMRDPDVDLINQLHLIRTQLTQDKLNAIATIQYPFQMSKRDVETYFSFGLNDSYTTDYFCFDKDGNSLIRDEYWKSASFRSSLQFQYKINDSIAHNPINGSHFTQFTIVNDEHPGSPFKLFISTNKVQNDNLAIQQLDNLGIQYPNKTNNQLFDSKTIEKLSIGVSSVQLDDVKFQIFKKANDSIVYHRLQVFDLIKPISLFSYIFVFLGLLLVVIAFMDQFIEFLPSAFKYNFNQASLRNRIQVNIVLLIVVSFVIIGFVTVFYFQRVSKDQSINTIKTNLLTLSNNIELHLKHIPDISRAQRYMQDNLAEFANHYQAHLVHYDQFGNMVNATLPGMSNKKIAYDWISNLDENDQLYLPEYASVHDKDYIAGSALIRTNNLGLIGFVQLINQEQKSSITNVNDFLGTLLNVYVFLFLIAGALALAVSNSITYPIAVIGEKMRQFKLGKKNEKLEWAKKDELGALIDEYNQMIVKLEESADFIAKTERDFAWREMAKQVAHEIKNPLTPMKLSIQYMQKAIDTHPDRAKELIENVSSTLIEQIDNLSQIANEFSNFAKIPEAKNEKVIINEVVETVHDLFRKRDDMEILLSEPIDEIQVHADKNHLIRILNNLVKNAIQAIPQDRHGKIELFLYTEQQNAIIKVSDNGTGIPKEMEERVFVPNFTTKSSGTGLGLAISANMAESFNGRIYFETVEGEGTDFYIEIPLLRSVTVDHGSKRITLE